MLIMAIDHIRDNFHLGHPDPTDLATTTPALFLTRWITHFCAPVFVLLSGISAWLAGTRRTRRDLSFFLIKRGSWLILVELLIISPAIRTNWNYQVFALQVIWAIGGSMLILGILVGLKVPAKIIGLLGVLIVTGHNLLDQLHNPSLYQSALGKMFLTSTGPNRQDLVLFAGGHAVMIVYALLPWTGLMLIGYWFGRVYASEEFDAAKRKTTLLRTGLAALAAFLVLRTFNLYGDPSPWSAQHSFTYSVLSFLNVTKYPCSLLYCCLTVGVALLILSATEHWNNRFTHVLIRFGSVPFLYYVLHWYLLQSLHILTFYAQGFTSDQIVNPRNPFLYEPPGFGFGLPGVYAVWLVILFLLYWPCRWFSNYKKSHHQWWLSYL